jgi:VWFA-related protein
VKTRTGLGLALGVAATAAAQTPSSSPAIRPPTFAAGVASVRLDVYAAREGQPLAGLTGDDFVVLDDGVPQKVEVESSGGPVHAILLLDTSGSVAGERLEHLKTAAHAFVNGLGPDDQATLLTFSHEVRLAGASSAGGNRAELHRALDAARAGGGTALHDALYAALQFADPARGRAVVLVFSDGDDRLSWLDAEHLRQAARRSEASVYAVALADAPVAPSSTSVAYLPDASRQNYRRPGEQDRPANAFRPEGSSSRHADLSPLLRDVAGDTGGQVWRADDGPQLQAAFLQALAQVKSRYLLRFDPTVARPGWHALEVKLRTRKGDVRARKGYFAAPLSPS